MKKIKNIIRKIAIILAVLMFNVLGFLNSVYAASVNPINLYLAGDCGQLLKYKGVVVKTSYIEYINENNRYPAYCLDKTKPGIETIRYDISVQGAIQDIGLWKRIINGYPYKSMQELGVANKEEAFTATKQAVYCYIHGNNPSDYEAIGEAGQRTLNAMNKIISDAQNSNESKISSTIKINESSDEWMQDKIDKNYVFKTYSISANAQIQNYKIKVTRENEKDLGGIKLTDENNIEKQEFLPNEKFKILIPIKNMTENGKFKLEVESKVNTKPVLYGIATNSEYQDYAITAATYEDGNGYMNDEYNKNETKIIILKQDEETKEKLKGVEFELLDENKQIVYGELKTDEEGKVQIENLIPGRYFLREVNSIDGYQKNEDLIKIDIALNEQISVTVNNRKNEKPEVKVIKDKVSISNKKIKKLPVTGM